MATAVLPSGTAISKGKKKNRSGNYFAGKKNIVAAELYDDLQDKIEQVKKVVRNRSKMDIALVLRSCEQADNAVDAAIAKLIGPDGGRECLQEWAVQPRKNKTKPGSNKAVKTGSKVVKTNDSLNILAKPITDNKGEEGLSNTKADALPVNDTSMNEVATTVNGTTPTSSSSLVESQSKGTEQSDTNKRVEQSIKPAAAEKSGKGSRPSKKKPRPPKRIRDKLKQLVPPDNQDESAIYSMDTIDNPTVIPPQSDTATTPTTKEQVSNNESEQQTADGVEQLVNEPPLPHNSRPSHTSPVGSSGNESGICSDSSCSISTTGTVSPIDNCSPVREQHPLTLSAESFPMKLNKTSTDTPTTCQTESFKKLLKDLHRCDVSLSRYQNTLNEQCDLAIKELQKVFTILRIGLSTREEDIYNEIQFIRQTAGHILHRRKITCASLKTLAEESVSNLEEHQVLKLKKQLKQFITERGIDEELGLSRRFTADPDDLLPSIMKFGKTCGVQAYYSLWNEFPAEAVGKNPAKPLLLSPVMPPPLIKNAPPIMLPPPSILQPSPGPHMPPTPPQPPHGFSIPFPIPPHAILNRQSVFNKIPILPTPPIPPMPQLPHPPQGPPQVEYINDEFGKRRKYSPEKLVEIQERVKGSLKAQGVCLYNPFTGEAMKSELSDPNSVENNSSVVAAPIKKTPTQQRRERKRRQKEREKRQRELMPPKNQQQKMNESQEKVEAGVSNKVGKPASVAIIKTGYRPWWQRRYITRHPLPTPHGNTTRRPHPLNTPTLSNKHKKSEIQTKDNAKKDQASAHDSKERSKISSPITVT